MTETSTGAAADGGGRDLPHRAQRRDVLGGPEQQLHDHLRQRHADGQPGRVDDHRANDATARSTARSVTFAATAFTANRPGQRRHPSAACSSEIDGTDFGSAVTLVGGSATSGAIVPAAGGLHRSRPVQRRLHDFTLRTGTLTDGQPGGADDHGQQREQDLRPDGDLRRHRVHGQRPGQRRHGQQRDRDQHGRGGRRRRSGPTPSCPAPRRSRRA